MRGNVLPNSLVYALFASLLALHHDHRHSSFPCLLGDLLRTHSLLALRQKSAPDSHSNARHRKCTNPLMDTDTSLRLASQWQGCLPRRHFFRRLPHILRRPPSILPLPPPHFPTPVARRTCTPRPQRTLSIRRSVRPRDIRVAI